MEDEVTEKIAGNVRAALAYRAISGKDAAAHLGMTQNQFSRRYNGNVAWRISETSALAELLNVSLTALVSGDGLREPKPQAVEEPVEAPGDEAERRRELLGDRVDELLKICRRLTSDIDRTRVALELIQRELRDL